MCFFFPQNPWDMSSLKSNGWNVKSHPVEMEKSSDPNLHFCVQNVDFPRCINSTNLPSIWMPPCRQRYTEKHRMVRSVTCGPLASSCSRSAEKKTFFEGKEHGSQHRIQGHGTWKPRTQLTSIFEGQPLKTRPFPSKTRVIWVLATYIWLISMVFM